MNYKTKLVNGRIELPEEFGHYRHIHLIGTRESVIIVNDNELKKITKTFLEKAGLTSYKERDRATRDQYSRIEGIPLHGTLKFTIPFSFLKRAGIEKKASVEIARQGIARVSV